MACQKAMRSSRLGWEAGWHTRMKLYPFARAQAHKGGLLYSSSPRQVTGYGVNVSAGVWIQRVPAICSPSCVSWPSCGRMSSGGKAMTCERPGHTTTGVMAE